MFIELLHDALGKSAGERILVADADGERLIQQGTAQAVADGPVAPLVGTG